MRTMPNCVEFENILLDEFEKSPFLASIIIGKPNYGKRDFVLRTFYSEANRKRFQQFLKEKYDETAKQKLDEIFRTSIQRDEIFRLHDKITNLMVEKNE